MPMNRNTRHKQPRSGRVDPEMMRALLAQLIRLNNFSADTRAEAALAASSLVRESGESWDNLLRTRMRSRRAPPYYNPDRMNAPDDAIPDHRHDVGIILTRAAHLSSSDLKFLSNVLVWAGVPAPRHAARLAEMLARAKAGAVAAAEDAAQSRSPQLGKRGTASREMAKVRAGEDWIEREVSP